MLYQQGGDSAEFATYSEVYFEDVIDKRQFANTSYIWISRVQEARMAEHQPSPGQKRGIYRCIMLNMNFGFRVMRIVALPLA